MGEPAQIDGRAQRGRKPNRPDPDAGPVAAFADRLWRLKAEAGDPSFAEMASRLGAAASKSSLAAAAQGRTLPSWGTTWEFVRVLAVVRLGRDPQETEREWRDLWRRTKALTELEEAEPPQGEASQAEPLKAGPSQVEPTQAGLPQVGLSRTESAECEFEEAEPAFRKPLLTAGPEPDTLPSQRVVQIRPKRLRMRTTALIALVASAVLSVCAVFLVLLLRGDPPESHLERQALQALQVDDSSFEGDITYPDGTRVKKGESFEKVWRLRNVGAVPWEGRFLMRVNDTICHAPDRVEIARTMPGESVDIKVPVQAPDKAGSCRIYWKMVDLQGRSLFPGKRAIFLDVRVR